MIHHILLPLGISEAISSHLSYAFHLAKRLGARLTLLQTYPLHTGPMDAGGFPGITPVSGRPLPAIDEEEIKRNTKKHLKELPITREVKYELIVSPGIPQTTVSAQYKEFDPDLLIIDGEEAVGLESFFGTEAEALSRKAGCPTLVVPDDYEFRPYQKIVVALDKGKTKDEVSLDGLIYFTKKFKSSLDALHVSDASQEEMTEEQEEIYHSFKNRMIPADITNFTFQTITESDPTQGIYEFIQEKKADLLVLLYRDHGIFKRLFNPGVRKQVIQEAGVPTLILK